MKLEQSIPYLLLKSARPRQWVKNFALYAALIFSGFLFFNPTDGQPYFVTVTIAVILFSALTSSIYIINDVIDREADRNHPFKRKRPIASGDLPVSVAIGAAILGLAIVMVAASWLNPFFRILAILYFCLQMFYAKYLKHIPILDISSIATGFVIRIYAGAVVVNLHMNVWFLLTVISAALFMAVAKRQSERTMLSAVSETNLGNTRKILKRYTQRLLDQYTGMFATATWLTYAIFSFQYEQVFSPGLKFPSIYLWLPRSLHTQKLLMFSLPFVIFIVMRYLQLVYEKNEGESPERILLSDKPLLVASSAFGFIVIVVLYLLQ